MPEQVRLQLMSHGRLATLIRRDEAHSCPIQFLSPHPEKQSNIELEVKLHMRSKEKGFTII